VAGKLTADPLCSQPRAENFRPGAANLPAQATWCLARTVISATLSEFLVLPARCLFLPPLILSHIHDPNDLVLILVTMIHSRADHCITE
jgi:hypothetical protein